MIECGYDGNDDSSSDYAVLFGPWLLQNLFVTLPRFISIFVDFLQVVVQRLQTGAFATTRSEEDRGRWHVVETRNSVDHEKGASSIFSQIAAQVAELNVADLRLPARSWKVRTAWFPDQHLEVLL